MLYRRFLDALGMDETWRAQRRPVDEALVWKQMFLLACSSGGPGQALGALGIGTELIVKYVYAPVLRAIKRHLNVTPYDRVFFDLHSEVDDTHADVLIRIAIDYARYERYRSDIRQGTLMALNLRMAFYDALMARAIEMTPCEEYTETMCLPDLQKVG